MNLFWGLLAVGTAGACLALAWRLARRGRTLEAALAITAAGLALRLYAGCDLFLHAWDERFHALVAKHLALHPGVPTLYEHPVLPFDYRDWRANQVWLHKPPLALWLMAASMRLLGVDEIAMRLPGILLSTVAVFLTCIIGIDLCGRRAGLLAGSFHAVNGYLLQFPAGRVAVDHVDNALVFFVELGVFFAVLQVRQADRARQRAHLAAQQGPQRGAPQGAQREAARQGAQLTTRQQAQLATPQRALLRRGHGWGAWLLVAAVGLSVGLALLSKWLPGLLPMPVWLALAWRRQGRGRIVASLLLMAALAAVVALPWNRYIQYSFPREAAWEASYNVHHLSVEVEGLGGSPLFHLARMGRYFGELVYLPVLWLLIELARRRAWRRRHDGSDSRPDLLPLAVWLGLPYLLFSFTATKLGGYVMVAAPAVFVVEAVFCLWLWDSRRGLHGGADAGSGPGPGPDPRQRHGALTAARWAVLALLLLLPLRYTVERLKIRPGYDRNPPWARALRALPARLGGDPRRPAVLFHFDEPIEAMFYTDYTAYERLPTPAEAARLLDNGYRVVVFDAAAAPAELRAVPGIELRPEAIPPAAANDGSGVRRRRADGGDSPLSVLRGGAPSS